MMSLHHAEKELSRARVFIAKLTKIKKYEVEAFEVLRSLGEVEDVIQALQTIFMPDADEVRDNMSIPYED